MDEVDPLHGTPYRAIREIGKGGMGFVYLAEHRALGRRVVVKVLRASMSFLPEVVDRMRVEAQVLARLRHPSLVEVFDLGVTSAGQPYYVMEELVGETMRALLARRGALPAEEAIQLVVPVLDALEVVHQAGLVHRDIKLENLFVVKGPRGELTVKVLDFGVAKVLQAHVVDGLVQPTEVGSVVGTPAYAAPEQALALPVDAKTDVYAVGLVLYRLLAGRGPFEKTSDLHAMLDAHVHKTPPAPSTRATLRIAPALDAIVLRTLAKRGADRPSVAELRELLLALHRAVEPEPLAVDERGALTTRSRVYDAVGRQQMQVFLLALLITVGVGTALVVLVWSAVR